MKTIIAAAASLFAAGAAQATSPTYTIEPTHTFVNFEVTHFGTSFDRGRWDKKAGTVLFDRAARTGRVELTIDMNSISSGVPQLDGHLKSKDFFNAAEHPTARFVSDVFVFNGDKVAAVEGTLTMLGKSHPVTLQANQFNCCTNPNFKREVCSGDFEGEVKRSDFGATLLLPLVGDRVRLLVQVEGRRMP